MECDKNMGLINQKSYAEVPDDWREVIRNARVRPSPFLVVDCKTEMFKAWGAFLDLRYKKKFPAATRPIMQLKIMSTHHQTVEHRETYNGLYTSTVVMDKKVWNKTSAQLCEPNPAYPGPISLPKEKYKDLQVLKRFCRQDAQDFITKLPVQDQTNVKK